MTAAQERDKRTNQLLAGKKNGQPDNIKDFSAYQNQLMQIQAERQQNAALAKQNLGAQQQVADVANSAAALAIGGAGGVGAGTAATLAKYGMPIKQTKKTQKNVNVVPNHITINNTTTINNGAGPVQGRPVQIAQGNSTKENQSRFQTWVSKVFAKQKETNAQAARQYEKREWSLSRAANKMMEKIQKAGQTVADSMNPEKIGASVGSQFKTLLFIFGMAFLAKYWKKVLDFAKGTYDFIEGVLDWFGITQKGRRMNEQGVRGSLKGDLWWFFTGQKQAPRGMSLIDMFVKGFKSVIDYFKTWLGGQMDIRRAALRSIKFPSFNFEMPKNSGGGGIMSEIFDAMNPLISGLGEVLSKSLSGVSSYLGNVLTAIIDPKAAVAKVAEDNMMTNGAASSARARQREGADMFEHRNGVNAGDMSAFSSESGRKNYSLMENALDTSGALIDGSSKHGYGGEVSQARDILGAYQDAKNYGVIDTDRLVSGLQRLYNNARDTGGVVVDKEFMMQMFGSTNAPGVKERRMKFVEADMDDRDKMLERAAGHRGFNLMDFGSEVVGGIWNGASGELIDYGTSVGMVKGMAGMKNVGKTGRIVKDGVAAVKAGKTAAQAARAATASTGYGLAAVALDSAAGGIYRGGKYIYDSIVNGTADSKYILVPEDDPRPAVGPSQTVYELNTQALDHLAKTKFSGSADFTHSSYGTLITAAGRSLEGYAGGAKAAQAKWNSVGSQTGAWTQQRNDEAATRYYADTQAVLKAEQKAEQDLHNTALYQSMGAVRQNTGELLHGAIDGIHGAIEGASEIASTIAGEFSGTRSPAAGGPGKADLNRVRAWLWGGTDFPKTYPNATAKARMDGFMEKVSLPGRDRSGKPITLTPRLHRALHDQFRKAFTEIQKQTSFNLYSCGGGYSFRAVINGTKTNALSNHAFGSAVDINVPDNPLHTPRSEMSPEFDSNVRLRSEQHKVVQIMKAYGFTWGGPWSCRDTMHFEFRDLSKLGVSIGDVPRTGSQAGLDVYSRPETIDGGAIGVDYEDKESQDGNGEVDPNTGTGQLGNLVGMAHAGVESLFGTRMGYYSEGGAGYDTSGYGIGSLGTVNAKARRVEGTVAQRANYVMSRLMKEAGLTKEQAAGVVGNLIRESNLNYTAVGDHGMSHGIAQWNDSAAAGHNWTKAVQWAKANGVNINSLEGQVEYLIHGWGSSQRAIQTMKERGLKMADSANLWGAQVERYSGVKNGQFTTEFARSEAHKRIVEAASVFQAFGNGEGITYHPSASAVDGANPDFSANKLWLVGDSYACGMASHWPGADRLKRNGKETTASNVKGYVGATVTAVAEIAARAHAEGAKNMVVWCGANSAKSEQNMKAGIAKLKELESGGVNLYVCTNILRPGRPDLTPGLETWAGLVKANFADGRVIDTMPYSSEFVNNFAGDKLHMKDYSPLVSRILDLLSGRIAKADYGSYEGVGFNAAASDTTSAYFDISEEEAKDPERLEIRGYTRANAGSQWDEYHDIIAKTKGFFTKEEYENYYNNLTEREAKREDASLKRSERLNLLLSNLKADSLKELFGTENIDQGVILENAAKLSEKDFAQIERMVERRAGLLELKKNAYDKASYAKWIEEQDSKEEKKRQVKSSLGIEGKTWEVNEHDITGNLEVDQHLHALIAGGATRDELETYLKSVGIDSSSKYYYKRNAELKDGKINNFSGLRSEYVDRGTTEINGEEVPVYGYDYAEGDRSIIDRAMREVGYHNNVDLYEELDKEDAENRAKIKSLDERYDKMIELQEKLQKYSSGEAGKDYKGALWWREEYYNKDKADKYLQELLPLMRELGYENYAQFAESFKDDLSKLQLQKDNVQEKINENEEFRSQAESAKGLGKGQVMTDEYRSKLQEWEDISDEIAELNQNNGEVLSPKEIQERVKKISELQARLEGVRADVIRLGDVTDETDIAKKLMEDLKNEATTTHNARIKYEAYLAEAESIIKSGNILNAKTPEQFLEEVKNAFANFPSWAEKFAGAWPGIEKRWNNAIDKAKEEKQRKDNLEDLYNVIESEHEGFRTMKAEDQQKLLKQYGVDSDGDGYVDKLKDEYVSKTTDAYAGLFNQQVGVLNGQFPNSSPFASLTAFGAQAYQEAVNLNMAGRHREAYVKMQEIIKGISDEDPRYTRDAFNKVYLSQLESKFANNADASIIANALRGGTNSFYSPWQQMNLDRILTKLEQDRNSKDEATKRNAEETLRLIDQLCKLMGVNVKLAQDNMLTSVQGTNNLIGILNGTNILLSRNAQDQAAEGQAATFHSPLVPTPHQYNFSMFPAANGNWGGVPWR